ncbi:hypothetical protein ACLOJK_005711 [Asimina triloba]
MGNSKFVPVAGLAITVRLNSHMMHATSSPMEITLHSALHGQAASSHVYKRADAMGEKDTHRAEAKLDTRERERKIKKGLRARRATSVPAGQIRARRARRPSLEDFQRASSLQKINARSLLARGTFHKSTSYLADLRKWK